MSSRLSGSLKTGPVFRPHGVLLSPPRRGAHSSPPACGIPRAEASSRVSMQLGAAYFRVPRMVWSNFDRETSHIKDPRRVSVGTTNTLSFPLCRHASTNSCVPLGIWSRCRDVLSRRHRVCHNLNGGRNIVDMADRQLMEYLLALRTISSTISMPMVGRPWPCQSRLSTRGLI